MTCRVVITNADTSPKDKCLVVRVDGPAHAGEKQRVKPGESLTAEVAAGGAIHIIEGDAGAPAAEGK